MVNKKVKFAPQSVIEELDNFEGTPSDLFSEDEGILLKLSKTGKWVFLSAGAWQKEREIAVYNHVFGTERLQPERDPHWTVEKEINGYTKSLVFENGETNFREYTDGATYMFGLTEEQARGYAELFGGEPKEIK